MHDERGANQGGLKAPQPAAEALTRGPGWMGDVAFTTENAKEMARRAVDARLKNAELRAAVTADARAREVLASHAEALAKELLRAALGKGDYAGQLKPRERLHAVIKALEWGIGRPRPAIQSDRDATADEEPIGLVITTATGEPIDFP
jgi:hypothetical protein